MKLLNLIGYLYLLQFLNTSEPFSLDTKAHLQPLQKVRMTVYWSAEDPLTRRKLSSSGVRLRSGAHAAADPRYFPYGTKIRVDGWGVFTVVDSGTAVISRRASKGKLPVIDVYCDDQRQAERLIRTCPEITYITRL